MKAIVQKPFKGAVNAADIDGTDFKVGDVLEGAIAEIAVREKWAVEDKGAGKSGRKALAGAPENKDAGNAAENKSLLENPTK